MLREDEIGNRYWGMLFERFSDFQLYGVDNDGTLIAAFNSLPVDQATFHEWRDNGWRGALFSGCETGPKTPVLCALAASILPAHRGRGLSRPLLERARETSRRHGHAAMIAPVRPTQKARYPLTSFSDYVGWRTDGGAAFDPWIRVHEHLGAAVTGIAPRSMIVRGTVATWEGWTGLRFPQSGDYVVPHALNPVSVDLDADEAVYVEPNLWMRHPL